MLCLQHQYITSLCLLPPSWDYITCQLALRTLNLKGVYVALSCCMAFAHFHMALLACVWRLHHWFNR